MVPILGTNPLGINVEASIGTRAPEPTRQSRLCVITCDTVYDYLYYFTRIWGISTATVLAGVGVDFIYHNRFPGYLLIAYAVTIFIAETLWILTLFLKLMIRVDHNVWRIWKYCTMLDDWKKSPVYIFIGLMTMYKPYKLWLVYLAGGATIFLGIMHLLLSIFLKVLKSRSKKKENRSGHSDLESLESRFEEVTDVLDDCLPDPMPGSSVSLSDSLHPDPDTILEI
ncbi:hypothetical protein ABEB36_005374 [Hypothenemus hampei]|uniref:Transmembrane protein 72 n=1 Tax=Hypothenemus hampei TaxID=57062 RepID=A0ABD1EY13_HYPHA